MTCEWGRGDCDGYDDDGRNDDGNSNYKTKPATIIILY